MLWDSLLTVSSPGRNVDSVRPHICTASCSEMDKLCGPYILGELMQYDEAAACRHMHIGVVGQNGQWWIMRKTYLVPMSTA